MWVGSGNEWSVLTVVVCRKHGKYDGQTKQTCDDDYYEYQLLSFYDEGRGYSFTTVLLGL